MMNPRKWTAWKLTQLAELLYDSEYTDTLVIYFSNKEVARIEVIGNTYGSGIAKVQTTELDTDIRWT